MFSIKSWVICGVVCLVLWGGYLGALNWMAWHFGREMVRDSPAVAVMPQPLINHALADLSSGAQIEYFGYSARFPWPKVTTRHDLKSATLIGFDGGASVILMDYTGTINALNVYRGSPEQEAQLRKVFGDKAFQSRFDFLTAEFQASPKDLGILHSRLRNTRAATLLTLKSMEVLPGTTAIYPVSADVMHGFQVGDPKITPRRIRLILFDQQDRQMEMILRGPKIGAALTQEQINGIIASVQPPA